MNKYALKIIIKNENKFIKSIVDRLEEEGIAYEILKNINESEVDINKLPLDVAILVDYDVVRLIGRDINSDFLIFNDCILKNAKIFGSNVGRYIKGLPLKEY